VFISRFGDAVGGDEGTEGLAHEQVRRLLRKPPAADAGGGTACTPLFLRKYVVT
jgi:hypothetical protein